MPWNFAASILSTNQRQARKQRRGSYNLKFHFIHKGVDFNHCVSKSNNFYHISIFMFVCVPVWKYRKTKKKTNCFTLWLVLFYIYYLHQSQWLSCMKSTVWTLILAAHVQYLCGMTRNMGCEYRTNAYIFALRPNLHSLLLFFCCFCSSSLLLRVKMLQSIKTYLISKDKIRLIRWFFTHFDGKYFIWISLTHITILPYS